MNSYTIVSIATPTGVGALSIIRLSGYDALVITNSICNKNLLNKKTHTLVYASIIEQQQVIDDVVIGIFKGPHSFTKEDTVEITCHGSSYIIHKIITLLLSKGAHLAKPGEFTQRAFLNGRFDLAQAEAVADLIASDSASAHHAAMHQMRGGFSKEISLLRQQLIEFASLIELELDFGEEDVEFANRIELRRLINQLLIRLNQLISSFDAGNVIKNGVPTVIAGKPNAGKSTLLNTLLNDDKAIVSDIPGTTRDLIEDEIFIEGIKFRLVDTAGLRETTDKVEAMGVEKTQKRMKQASIILYIIDSTETSANELRTIVAELSSIDIPYIVVGNKLDAISNLKQKELNDVTTILWISAANHMNIDSLKEKLVTYVKKDSFKTGDVVVTNIRHYEHLTHTKEALEKVLIGMDKSVTSDWLALDIRDGLHNLGQITGEITNDDLLATISLNFALASKLERVPESSPTLSSAI